VLVLHAGAAAAGLTLIAARHVFLMEPFMDRGQELQALNRCHRIGQQHSVSCTTYYCPGTVEERLLAYRTTEGALADAAASMADGEAEETAVAVVSTAAEDCSLDKRRFLFGMLGRLAEGESEGAGEGAGDV